MQFKSVLLASAFAATAFAATATTSEASSVVASSSLDVTSGCSFETFTASSQGDLDRYTSCSALEGDLLIEGSAIDTATLPGVQAIYGNLIIKNATELTSFTAENLATITGQLDLSSLTILATLGLPSLTTVGSISLVTIPALSSITLTAGVSQINSLYISDTALETLDGFDVSALDTFNVNNNKNLETIDVSLKTVKTALEVSYNSEGVEVNFDDLIWANNITFRQVSKVSLAALEKVNSTMNFLNNTMTEIEVPLLAAVGGSLSISENSNLDDLDFSNLTSIGGGFDISNNTNLDAISGFDSLSTVGGAIIFSGNFTNVTLPDLKRVQGGVTVTSTGDLVCDDLDDLKSASEGTYSCKGEGEDNSDSASGTSTDGSSDSTATDGSDDSTSTGDKTSTAAGAAAPNFAVPSGTFLAIMGSFIYALL